MEWLMEITPNRPAPLQLLYHDEFLVAIDKPAGMLVHPVNAAAADSGISAMKRLRDQLGQHVFPIHRLDRPTSGVLLFALDKQSAALGQQAFEQRLVRKTYQAVVCGAAPPCWDCEVPLRAVPGGALLAARTSFRCLRISENFAQVLSLVEAVPQTGRFHQIRRHLLHEGLPIVGDFRSAGSERSFALGELLGTGTRMLLQAKRLEFTHPRSGVAVSITAPPAPEICNCFPEETVT
jgi:tRNA pseudouridine65 synthase